MKGKVISLEQYIKDMRAKHEAVEHLREDLLTRIKNATLDKKIDLILRSKRS